MAKIHLIISSDPVENGFDRTALCGVTVPKAEAVALTEMAEPASSILFCKDCFGRNYFYAISTGQERRDLEGE